MHPRNRNGWGGILGSEDLSEDYEERTDPNLESPAFGEAGSEAETTIAPNPLATPRLKLPRPHSDASEAPSPSPPPALEFAVEVDQLVQKLEPAEKGRWTKKEERLFTKEVILTIVGGLALIGGAVIYSRSGEPEPQRPQLEQPAPPPAKAPAAAVEPLPPAVKTEAPPAATPPVEETRKATTPILSILSNPSGARVEINGTIYGTTPLIQPSPSNVKSLSIRLLKDNYKDFETLLTPNESGHFNLNATLEKR